MDQWASDITRNITRANSRNARLLLPDLKSRLARGETRLVDLGAGAGKTVLPIVKGLTKKEKQNVKLTLVDVSASDFENIASQLKQLGVPKENVTFVQASFGELLSNPKLKQLVGKADVVTSGAALHHVSRSETIFKEINKLLKKGGNFSFWDWSHPAWRGENLVVAPKGAKVSVNGRAYSYKGKIYKAKKGSAFLSRTRPTGAPRNQRSELYQAKEMLSTWVSLLNFPMSERRKFDAWFDKQVKQGKPINFGRYLQTLEKVAPTKEAKIEVMEAHKTYENYTRALRGSGLNPGKPVFSPDSSLLVHYNVKKK